MCLNSLAYDMLALLPSLSCFFFSLAGLHSESFQHLLRYSSTRIPTYSNSHSAPLHTLIGWDTSLLGGCGIMVRQRERLRWLTNSLYPIGLRLDRANVSRPSKSRKDRPRKSKMWWTQEGKIEAAVKDAWETWNKGSRTCNERQHNENVRVSAAMQMRMGCCMPGSMSLEICDLRR